MTGQREFGAVRAVSITTSSTSSLIRASPRPRRLRRGAPARRPDLGGRHRRDPRLALLGAGAVLGNLSTVVSQSGGLQQQAGQAAGQIDPAQALQVVQQGAGWAALALGLTVVAAAAGGMTGQKIGSSER